MRPYIKPQRIQMKSHPELTEKWVQARIKEDPAILGLGDLILLHEERIQPSGGRLDLLLQDPETKRRYEVELQLGATDETHIIRTIEYWDIERKRYPQYDHCAVIVAEDKIRSIRRDLLCLQVLLKSYGTKLGLEPATAESKIIFYYGIRSIPAPWSLAADDLDEHFGFPVRDNIEQANRYFQERLHELLAND